MTLLDKEPVQRVGKLLKKFDENLNVIILNSSARTALEAASSLGCEVGAIVKSLLFKTENTFTLCLVSGDKKVSLNKVKKLLKIKDASMATADEVKNITGFTIGVLASITGVILGILFSFYIENIRFFVSTVFNLEIFPSDVYFLDKMPSDINILSVGVIFIFSLLISAVASFFPARIVSKMKTIKALKYE